MNVLGIETTCDETAASVVMPGEDGRGRILSNEVLSQIAEHAAYGGVVPEIAARAHVEVLDRLIDRALGSAGLTLAQVDGIAVAAGIGNYLAGEASRTEAARQHAILSESERLLSNMVELETGMRGYVLFGEEPYLEPYQAAQNTIDGQLDTIETLTKQTDAQAPEHMRDLRRFVEAKRNYAAHVIDLRRNRGYDAAVSLARLGEGKRTMDGVRGAAKGVQNHATAVLAVSEERDRVLSLVLLLVSIASALGAVGLLGRLALVRRRDEQRTAALLDGVFANAPVGLGFLDRDLTIQNMNRALATMNERGFGADLGAEKFIDIKCRQTGLKPSAVVIVATAFPSKLIWR